MFGMLAAFWCPGFCLLRFASCVPTMTDKRYMAFEQPHAAVKVLLALDATEALTIKLDGRTLYDSIVLPDAAWLGRMAQDWLGMCHV